MDAVGRALQRVAATLRRSTGRGRPKASQLLTGNSALPDAPLSENTLSKLFGSTPAAVVIGGDAEMARSERLWEQLYMADAVSRRVLGQRVGRMAATIAHSLPPAVQRLLLRLALDRRSLQKPSRLGASIASLKTLPAKTRSFLRVVWAGKDANHESSVSEPGLVTTSEKRLEWSDAGLGERVVIVGVHGWVPSNRVLQGIVGAPRGTSERLARSMESAVCNWAPWSPSLLGAFEPRSRAISRIALHGAGTISERVELHAAQIDSDDSVNALRSADTVLFAAHSQGGPVSLLLAERLLRSGVIRRDARIGMLSMAGVFAGPHPLVGLSSGAGEVPDSWMLRYVEAGGGPAAAELFRLSDPRSDVSMRTREALHWLLTETDSRMCAVAAWMDPLVPLHSAALCSRFYVQSSPSSSDPEEHPAIWRALHVDRANAGAEASVPALLARIACVLAGASAPGGRRLLALLSDALYTSIVSHLRGGASNPASPSEDASDDAPANPHSSVYDDVANYRLLLHWMAQSRADLCSAALRESAKRLHDHFTPRLENPHELAFLLRGVSESPVVYATVRDDCEALALAFDEWHPERKALRMLRLQIEPFVRHLQSRSALGVF